MWDKEMRAFPPRLNLKWCWELNRIEIPLPREAVL